LSSSLAFTYIYVSQNSVETHVVGVVGYIKLQLLQIVHRVCQ